MQREKKVLDVKEQEIKFESGNKLLILSAKQNEILSKVLKIKSKYQEFYYYEFKLEIARTEVLTLTHNCGRVTQICVFNTVKLGTSPSSP